MDALHARLQRVTGYDATVWRAMRHGWKVLKHGLMEQYTLLARGSNPFIVVVARASSLRESWGCDRPWITWSR
jgi:hypothetical protein